MKKNKSVNISSTLWLLFSKYFVVVLLLVGIVGLSFMDSSRDVNDIKPVPTTIPNVYYCYDVCYTSGVWNASRVYCHDTGHFGSDGSWESDAGGFGYLMGCIYIPLKKGCYDVNWEMKVEDNSGNNTVAYIEVAHNMGLYSKAGRYITTEEFVSSNVYQNVSLSFCSTVDLENADFRVHSKEFMVKFNIMNVYLNPQ